MPLPPALPVRPGALQRRRNRPRAPLPGARQPVSAPGPAPPARRREGSRATAWWRFGGSLVIENPSAAVGVATSGDQLVAQLVGVSCHFWVRLPGRGRGTVYAVDGVDLAVRRGRTLGLVGESGS